MKDKAFSALFAEIRNGDEQAFAELYSEMKQPVYTLAYRILSSKEAAEDVAQDLFVKLFLSPPEESVRNPRAWIMRMTHNLAIDMLRRRKEHLNINDVQVADTESFSGDILRWDIEAAVARLPLSQRTVISLRLVGGLRFSEVSRITGRSLSSVYREYRKGIKSLQVMLNGGEL